MTTINFDSSKATLYICIRKIINNACKTNNPTPEMIKSSIDNGNIKITDEFWYEAAIYAQRVIKDNTKNLALSNAYGFYSYSQKQKIKYEDLISMSTIQIACKFSWLIDKYYQLHLQYTDENLIIAKLCKLISLIIPHYLTDLYRKISEDKYYQEQDVEHKKTELKHVRQLKSSVTCLSLDQNNSTDNNECITFSNILISNAISPEDSCIASYRIWDYLTPIRNNALELKNFFCRYNGVSTDELIYMETKMRCVEVFEKLKSDFSRSFNVNLDDLLFTESELTYKGKRTLHKAYDDYRCSSYNKVKTYIQKEYTYI